MVTFTGFEATVEQLAPFLGKAVLVTTESSSYGSHQAFGIFGSATFPAEHHSSNPGSINFSGAGSISWRRYSKVTVELLNRNDGTAAAASVGSADRKPGNGKKTVTVAVRVVDSGFVISDDPASAGRFVGEYGAEVSAISTFLNRRLTAADVERGETLSYSGETWTVWHVSI